MLGPRFFRVNEPATSTRLDLDRLHERASQSKFISRGAGKSSGRIVMKVVSIAAAAGALLLSGMADAAEIQVLSTQATQEAYLELVAQFEKASGNKVATIFTGTLNVQKRLADGELYDLIIMAGPALDAHSKLGTAVASRRRR